MLSTAMVILAAFAVMGPEASATTRLRRHRRFTPGFKKAKSSEKTELLASDDPCAGATTDKVVFKANTKMSKAFRAKVKVGTVVDENGKVLLCAESNEHPLASELTVPDGSRLEVTAVSAIEARKMVFAKDKKMSVDVVVEFKDPEDGSTVRCSDKAKYRGKPEQLQPLKDAIEGQLSSGSGAVSTVAEGEELTCAGWRAKRLTQLLSGMI